MTVWVGVGVSVWVGEGCRVIGVGVGRFRLKYCLTPRFLPMLMPKSREATTIRKIMKKSVFLGMDLNPVFPTLCDQYAFCRSDSIFSVQFFPVRSACFYS